MPEDSDIQLLKKICQQERTQIFTLLMLSMENPRLAGYMLTVDSFYVPQYQWQPRLAIPLPPDAFSTTRDESMF